MIMVSGNHPPKGARCTVLRDGVLYTATPCYGMHPPWWVVQTMDGEAKPTEMKDNDLWQRADRTVVREQTDASPSIGSSLYGPDHNPADWT